jgi:hypothetical protein
MPPKITEEVAMKSLIILLLIYSCKNNRENQTLPMAQKKCTDKIKGDYNTYFDAFEKCKDQEAKK